MKKENVQVLSILSFMAHRFCWVIFCPLSFALGFPQIHGGPLWSVCSVHVYNVRATFGTGI